MNNCPHKFEEGIAITPKNMTRRGECVTFRGPPDNFKIVKVNKCVFCGKSRTK